MSESERKGTSTLSHEIGELSGLLRAAADVLKDGGYNVQQSFAMTIRERLAALDQEG